MSSLELVSVRKHRFPTEQITPYNFIMELFYDGKYDNDRMGFLTQWSQLNWKPLYGAQSLSAYTDLSFEQHVNNRYNDIINLAKDKDRIIIIWSGGIDSSFVTTLFIDLCVNKHITILCSQESVKESPELFQWFKTKTTVDIFVEPTNDLYYGLSRFDNYLAISGMCGDCCAISHKLFKDPCVYNDDWKTIVSVTASKRKQFKDLDFSYTFEMLSLYLDNWLFPIKTWAQFCTFWMNTIRTHSQLDRLFAPNKQLSTNVIAFFEDDNLLNWTMYNIIPDIEDAINDIRVYKKNLKQYIKKVTRHDWFDYKTKTISPIYDQYIDTLSVIDNTGLHYLGNNLTDAEKQQILLQRYGKSSANCS